MTMKTTLLIMAAGLGSRFGQGIKQLTPVGPGGELIIDYSIHDALEAGFDRVVFIIRKDIEADYKEVIGNRNEKLCEVAYAYQEVSDLPGEYRFPDRTKPWGTGHAVLAAKDLIQEPFCVINADDYYGKEAFCKIHEFLTSAGEKSFCMAGFVLENTLSEHGSVTRGICEVDETGQLLSVRETYKIEKTETGAAIEGEPIDAKAHVSMNMWGLLPDYLELLERDFIRFLGALSDPLKDEYLLPIHMDELIKNREATVKMLETKDKWFGVTYAEDREYVVRSFEELVEAGVYESPLDSR